MYKIYQTNFKPWWINSENKPSYSYFNTINFSWELINTGMNYTNEQNISFVVNNLDKIYFKIERYENNNLKDTQYFYFESILRRMDEGFVISCRLDLWCSYNILVENKLITDNKLVKFRRAHLNLKKF